MKIIGELDAEDFLTIQNMINLKNLDLEEVNLTELPTKAFYKMKTIENLILPHTLTIINDSEFYQNSLKSIIISSNVETIGEYAFYECPLKSINIPASVKAINKAAFMNCSSLATITFSKGSMLTKICGGKGFLSHGEKYYYGAFANCTALTSIEIPANVEIIEEAAFKNCTALTTVTFENNSSLKTICGATYDYSYYGGAFSDCISLISIEIPASVETIEAAAFKGCSKLATVTFEKGSQLKTIGGGYSNSSDYYGAFSDCTGLQEAYIGDGVTEIAAKAFAECTALKTVVIGKSIQRIGDQAFNTRSSWDQMTLEKITVLFDDIASGSVPVLERGSRGVFPKPGGWDLVSYKIYVPKGTKAEYQKNWSDYSSLIVEMQ